MTTVTLPRLLATVGIGILYYLVIATAWGYLAAFNPMNEMLLDALVRHERHLVAYRIIISLHDVGVNLLMALPFAAVFRFLPALRSWTYVTLAAGTAVVATYAPAEWEGLSFLLRSWAFWLGVAMTALSLPVTFALLAIGRAGPIDSPVAQDAA